MSAYIHSVVRCLPHMEWILIIHIHVKVVIAVGLGYSIVVHLEPLGVAITLTNLDGRLSKLPLL